MSIQSSLLVYAVVFVDAWLLKWMKCLVVDVVDVFLEE